MKINKVHIKNFKKFQDHEIELSDFDLVVGLNNSGKSTLLQALAVWQFCIDQFIRSGRKGESSIQILLPNFTALPIPEFSLLWFNKTDRGVIEGKQELFFIEIEVFWKNSLNQPFSQGVKIRYNSPQNIYASPSTGWEDLRGLSQNDNLPRIGYIPPFSGLEPVEQWLDQGPILQKIGFGQPGSVIRNLLWRIVDRPGIKKGEKLPLKDNKDWNELKKIVKDWFDMDLLPPAYEIGVDVYITSNYQKLIPGAKKVRKEFDLVSAGSGFHQIVTILALALSDRKFTTLLLDEPDAHLHTTLQRKIISYFLAEKKHIQFIIASHSERLIEAVPPQSILSIMPPVPKRFPEKSAVMMALSEVEVAIAVKVQASPYILYLEGEDDDRILSAWAQVLGFSEIYQRFCPVFMGGGSKKEMEEWAENHCKGVRQIVPTAKRLTLLDYDSDDAHHPNPNNTSCYEWKRKNIDNYLLVPDAWLRAIADAENQKLELIEAIAQPIITQVFQKDRLTLLPGEHWKTVDAISFKTLDGKKILFENETSLYRQLLEKTGLSLNRTKVAVNMVPEEIHIDVLNFFSKMEAMVTN